MGLKTKNQHDLNVPVSTPYDEETLPSFILSVAIRPEAYSLL